MEKKNKECTKCKIRKDLSEFGKRKVSRDKRTSECSECIRVRAREYRNRNLESCRERAARWRRDNPKRNLKYMRRYREENKDLISEQARVWNKANPELVLRYARRYRSRTCKKSLAELSRLWREKNRETYSKSRIEKYESKREKYLSCLRSMLSIGSCDNPTTLYLLKIKGLYKIGITTQVIFDRYRYADIDSMSNIVLYHTSEFHAKSIEKIVLFETRDYKYNGITPFSCGTKTREIRLLDMKPLIERCLLENDIEFIKEGVK